MTKILLTSRWIGLVVATLVLSPSRAAAQTLEPVNTAAAADWREDLSRLAHHLVTAHGDPFHSVTRSEFERRVDDLRRRIPDLARHQIIVEMQRITATIGDGHTSMALFFDPDVEFHRLPIRLDWYADGIFAEAVADTAGLPVGSRLTAIGGVGIEEAVDRVTPLISRDNDIWIRVMAPILLASPEVLHAVGLSDEPTGADFTVEHEGRSIDVRLRAEDEPFSLSHGPGQGLPPDWVDARAADAQTPLWRRQPGRPYWYEYLPDARILYIQYDMVNDAHRGPGVHEFFSEALGQLDERSVRRVVLDIRANGGGEGQLNTGVVRQLVRRSELDEPGRFIVIIGRRTFSAAQLLAHELDRWTQAIFVGEPTGSSPQFWGDHRRIELPNSGIQVSASPTWWQPGGPYDRREFLPPLLAFEPRFEDYVTGRDPAMDAIVDWENQQLSLDGPVLHALARGDTAGVEASVRAWTENPVHRYQPATRELNRIGYALLRRDRADAALPVFRLNVELHPEYANGWDSLGETLLRLNEREEGLAAYRRAYELDPDVGNAAAVLERETGGHP